MKKQDYVLEVKDLKTTFKVGRRRVHAVNSVTFSLKRGKTLCIVGESGCGKSVTAHSIMQLLPKNGILENGTVTYYHEPDSMGQVISEYKRNGKEIRSIRGKDIAMIFQDPMSTLNPVYTIGSQIMENLRSHEKIDKVKAKARIIRLLSDLGIPTPEKRYDILMPARKNVTTAPGPGGSAMKRKNTWSKLLELETE